MNRAGISGARVFNHASSATGKPGLGSDSGGTPLLIGPFKSFRESRKRGMLVAKSASPLHPEGSLVLDPARVRAVLKGGDGNYYVVYEPGEGKEAEELEAYLSPIPDGYKELGELRIKRRIVTCRDDVPAECPRACLEDPYYDPACFDYVDVTEKTVVLWSKASDVDLNNVRHGKPSLMTLLRTMSSRNASAVLGLIARWDLSREVSGLTNIGHVVGDWLAETNASRGPIVRVNLLKDVVEILGEGERKRLADYAVLVLYEAGIGRFVQMVKLFGSKEEAEKFYSELVTLLKAAGLVSEAEKEAGEQEKKAAQPARAPGREAGRRPGDWRSYVLSRVPGWADAALVERRGNRIVVTPLKRGRYSDYYAGTRWRSTTIKYLPGTAPEPPFVVTRDGAIRDGVSVARGGKYISVYVSGKENEAQRRREAQPQG